jgi:hypothetical protein
MIPGLDWSELSVGQAVTRLAVARGGLIDDTTSEVYLDLLGDLDPAAVCHACAELATEPRGAYEPVLPAVAVIRARAETMSRRAAAEAQARRVLPLPKTDAEGPRYFCLDCRDEPSAWRVCWCPGKGALRTMDRPERSEGSIVECARAGVHAPHAYVERCQCAGVNPVVARYHERRRQRSA